MLPAGMGIGEFKYEFNEKMKTLTKEQKVKLAEKLVFFKDKKTGKTRRFDTDSAENKKYVK